jgi:subtilase family serine protease
MDSNKTVTATFTNLPEGHDVEAFSQTVTDNQVIPGDLVDIEVTVLNNGIYTETFDLTCYYDSVEIGIELVVDLAPGEIRVITFTWDTTGIPMNGYPITAWADSGETIAEVDESNNACTMPLSIFVIPELPMGTILVALSMFATLIGYVGFKRYRTK